MVEEAGFEVAGLAAQDSSGILSPFSFNRRYPNPSDVVIKILYCGICHSDLHQIRDEWHQAIFPVVPGHEITGVVTQVGSGVTKFKTGDRVGVGCIVDSCRSCDACGEGLENYCERPLFTYNSPLPDGSHTFGGFSTMIVVDESFVIKVPANLPLAGAAPLLCAGITVFSPMKYYGMDKAGKSFGVVGLGGLGHMAIKFGKAFGMKVTVISTSPNKEKEAKEVLGADEFLVSKDPKQMAAASKSLDFILDTVSAHHALEPLLSLLKINGKLVMVGIPEKPLQLVPGLIIFGRRMIAGSMIGGLKETQEMMDFCGEHNLTATIEQVSMDYANTAMERLAKSDVKYRFVFNMTNKDGASQ